MSTHQLIKAIDAHQCDHALRGKTRILPNGTLLVPTPATMRRDGEVVPLTIIEEIEPTREAVMAHLGY